MTDQLALRIPPSIAEPAGPYIGCIADDVTGAVDTAAALRRSGLPTTVLFRIPAVSSPACGGRSAVVIGLKTRTIAATVAVDSALAAVRWLRDAGVQRFYFKYCSTFDSTADGNIGPVADALCEALESPITVVCPANIENGRTVYQGHLFVHDRLLSESSMRHHPLTPMEDSDLQRLLSAQTQQRVGLVAHHDVRRGAAAVRERLDELRARGVRHAVTDAVSEADLSTIARATTDFPLLTGASGLAAALPAAYGVQGHRPTATPAFALPEGGSVVLAGSCSPATVSQVAHAERRMPTYAVNPSDIADNEAFALGAVVAWAAPLVEAGPVLVTSTASPKEVARAQEVLGRDISARIEAFFGRLARRLVDCGVRRLVVAGGETSAAVLSSLEVTGLDIGPEIDLGVPWGITIDGPPIALALKSGNFGMPDFFSRAWTEWS